MSTAQNLKMQRQPTLVLAPEAWQTMLTFVQLCPDEISGWAYVRSLSSHTLYVGEGDVFITDQEVSIGSADVDGATMALAFGQAAQENRVEQMRLQWHSHVNGATNFSFTDTSTMDTYGSAGAVWIVSLVLNKRGEARARLDLYTPMRVSTDIPVVIAQRQNQALIEFCKEQILTHVNRKPKPVATSKQGKSQNPPPAKPITEEELTPKDVRIIPLPINPT